jgi:Aromatic-ring-opening dioxygenase LigAB, LigA subunit
VDVEEGPGPPKPIGEFLTELADDPELLGRYREDPEAVLAESGLTEEQQEIVRSNDLARIRDAVRAEYQRAEIFVVPVMHYFASGD